MDMTVGKAPTRLRKRDGRDMPFSTEKIARAIAAAGRSTGEFSEQAAATLAEAVAQQLSGEPHVEIEQVQDRVERALMAAGYFDTARATSSTASAMRACVVIRRRWWTSRPR